jgi:hypothetical protein
MARENEWQIGVAALLGLQHDLCPAILHLNNPNQAVAMLFKFLKYDQFPSLYYEDLHVALKAITKKRVTNYIVGNWYHCLQEIGILYDQLLPSSGYYDNFDLKCVNKVKRLVKKHYLSDVQTKVQRHLVRSERSLVNSQKKYQKIVVYRGFCVRPHESVRLNRSLCQNPQCFTQDAGAGINYTLDRDLAEEFARHPFTKNSRICDFQTRVRRSQLIYNLTETSPENFSRLARPYVATYLLDPNDILLNLSSTIESEIVASHDSVKLVRYDPVSYERL